MFAVFSIFPSRILQAIESSQLRLWEKAQGFFDKTDCVTMKVSRKRHQCGTIRLRIGFLGSLDISGILYGSDGNVL